MPRSRWPPGRRDVAVGIRSSGPDRSVGAVIEMDGCALLVNSLSKLRDVVLAAQTMPTSVGRRSRGTSADDDQKVRPLRQRASRDREAEPSVLLHNPAPTAHA